MGPRQREKVPIGGQGVGGEGQQGGTMGSAGGVPLAVMAFQALGDGVAGGRIKGKVPLFVAFRVDESPKSLLGLRRGVFGGTQLQDADAAAVLAQRVEKRLWGLRPKKIADE